MTSPAGGARPAIVVGVDGGGTKTDAIVADQAGTLLGLASAGPSNWEVVGLTQMAGTVGAVVSEALEMAGVEPDDVAAAVFAMAGFDWPSDRQRLDPRLASLGLGCPRDIVNDAFAALRAGTRHRHGCVSIAGTGGANAGRNRGGKTFRTFAGAWGEPMGASSIVKAALDAVARAHFGQSPETALTPRFLRALDIDSVPELFEQLSRGQRFVGAECAPLVFAAAADGDGTALTIAQHAGERHGAALVGVARRLQMLDDEFEVVRAGGVHRGSHPPFDAAFAACVERDAPHARLITLTIPPVVGAALLALELIGRDADGAHDVLLRGFDSAGATHNTAQ